MSKQSRVILLMVAVCVYCQTVQGDLITLTSGSDVVVSDSVTGLVWYADLSHFVSKTYSEQLEQIDDLNTDSYFGVTDWHIASEDELLDLFCYDPSDLGNVFAPSATGWWHGRWENLHEVNPWGISRRYAVGDGTSFFSPYGPFILDSEINSEVGAWVVGTPVPSAVLLGTIGLSVAGLKLRKLV